MQQTSEQTNAITTTEKHVVVTAGPGSGKTATMVARVQLLIEEMNVAPSAICVFTFTRNAALELGLRLNETGVPDVEDVIVGTFHAVAISSMTGRRLTIIDGPQQEALIKAVAERCGAKRVTRIAQKVEQLRFAIACGQGCEYSDDPKIKTVLVDYISSLKSNGLIDYHGLIMELSRAVDNSKGPLAPVEHVLVDEAQDTDGYQWWIVDRFRTEGCHTYLVGDPRQSIYEWRGAVPEKFLAQSSTKLSLSISFRNPPDAVDMANRVSDVIGFHDEKPLSVPESNEKPSGCSVSNGGVSVVVQGLMDEELYSGGQIAVLCRSNRMVQQVAEELRHAGIECMQPAKSQLDVLAPMLHFIANPCDITQRVFKNSKVMSGETPHRFLKPPDGLLSTELQAWVELWRDGLAVVPTVGVILRDVENYLTKESSASLLAWNNCYGDRSLNDALRDYALMDAIPERQHWNSPKVTVCTVHQAKGLEWPAVVAVCEGGRLPKPEDWRVFFVQATRCKNRCVFVGEGEMRKFVEDCLEQAV